MSPFYVPSPSAIEEPLYAQIERDRLTRPDDSRLLEQLVAQPRAVWSSDAPAGDAAAYLSWHMTQARAASRLPLVVLYNSPLRDYSGIYSAGGAAHSRDYLTWIDACVARLAGGPVWVILEPDALADSDSLDPVARDERLDLLREATRRLKQLPQLRLYVDAGNSSWVEAPLMAQKLRLAGIDDADGFSLNVSNYRTTAETTSYGQALSQEVYGKPFLIDTGRNGQGPAADAAWCNPSGRGIGQRPTRDTGHPLIDAFVWVKCPGFSDGEGNGGPKAGTWWGEQALELCRNAVPSLL